MLRVLWITSSVYIGVCLAIWLFLCFKYEQILDVRLSEFLAGWWRWIPM